MKGIVKIGYFRQVNNADGSVKYVSFKEFYDFGESLRRVYRECYESGACSYYCACQAEDTLPLIITSNLIVRVANNNGQSQHKESCPKSVFFQRFLQDSAETGAREMKGVFGNIQTEEGERMCYNITLPGLFRSSSGGACSSASASGAPSESRPKRMGLLSFVSVLNKIAWEKQTFSIKKQIKDSRASGQRPVWDYKDIDAFNRLVYGVSNDIMVNVRGEVIPFQRLFYNVAAYNKCNNPQMQWFIYAVVEKVSEFKGARKYQYVTLRMPSRLSKDKTTVRIPTADFLELFEGGLLGSGITILAGYVVRKVYQAENDVQDWMQLNKGITFQVSRYGLYCESEKILDASERLCNGHVVFKRPYVALENYGGLIPVFEFERKSDKNLLLDYALDKKALADRQHLGEGNEEYQCYLVGPDEADDMYVNDLIKKYGRKD